MKNAITQTTSLPQAQTGNTPKARAHQMRGKRKSIKTRIWEIATKKILPDGSISCLRLDDPNAYDLSNFEK